MSNFDILTCFFFFQGSFHISLLAVYRQRVTIYIKVNERFIRQDLSINARLCTALFLLPLTRLCSVSSKWTAVAYSMCYHCTQWQLPGKKGRSSRPKKRGLS